MKKYFLTGLAILLPLTFTFMIVVFLVHLLTDPFIGVVDGFLSKLGIFTSTQVQAIVSQILILAFLFTMTVFLGVFARWFIVNYFLRLGDAIVTRIPLVSSIYTTLKEVSRTIFLSKKNSFKQVVLVPFPASESQTIGLLTQENLKRMKQHDQIGVFIPTTPNPTSGYFIMMKKEDVIFLDMRVEEALKYVISCGVIQTNIRAHLAKHPEVQTPELS